MNLLEVHIWNTLVGVLVWDEKNTRSSFEYAPSFLKTGLKLSPLILPNSNKIVVSKHTPANKENDPTPTSHKGLPLFISDSLPDKFGTELFAKYIEKEGRNYKDLSPIEKLAYIGNRGMGALEFVPSKTSGSRKLELDLKKLSELSISLITKKPIAHLESMNNLFHVGTSPGGAQPKILINIDKETGVIYRGDETTGKNQESWILKFNKNIGDKIDTERGKIEYAYYLMAEKCGINMMESKLMKVGEVDCFMTKRFDRENGKKLHTQTLHAFAGMNFKLPNSYSYEQIFRLFHQLNFDYPTKEQLFKIMVFNVMGQNVDDHTKNFGFIMNEQGVWNFSPAYDLTFSYNENYNRVTPHFLSVNGKNEDISKADLMKVAKQFSIKNAQKKIDEITEVFRQWSTFAQEVGIDKEISDDVKSKLNFG